MHSLLLLDVTVYSGVAFTPGLTQDITEFSTRTCGFLHKLSAQSCLIGLAQLFLHASP